MSQLQEALQFPLKDKFWARRILTGGVVLSIPIINLFAIGYLARYFQSFLKGHKIEKLPEWDDLPTILTLGFFSIVILLGYLLIPVLLFLLALSVWGGVWGILFLCASIVIAIWLLSYYPMGLANYLITGTVSSAFQKGILYQKINKISRQYYLTVLVAILLLLIVTGGSPFVLFYLFLVFADVFGTTIQPVLSPHGPEEEAGTAH